MNIKPLGSGCCCLKSKVKNLVKGVEYKSAAHIFPPYFKKFIEEQANKNVAKKTPKKDVMDLKKSSEDLLKDIR